MWHCRQAAEFRLPGCPADPALGVLPDPQAAGRGVGSVLSSLTTQLIAFTRRFKTNCGTIVILQKVFGSITTADSSALVKLGNTIVICGVKAELAAPAVNSANKGYIVPNVELPSLCSERFCSRSPGEEAQAASQFIADVTENSQMIVKEDLYIANGKLDGCYTVILYVWTTMEPFGCQCLCFVSSIKKCTLLIVDPTAEEEDFATGTVTIVTDEEGRLCSVHKPGGSPLTGAKLQDCITRAITRHKEVKKLIDKVIKSIKPK